MPTSKNQAHNKRTSRGQKSFAKRKNYNTPNQWYNNIQSTHAEEILSIVLFQVKPNLRLS